VTETDVWQDTVTLPVGLEDEDGESVRALGLRKLTGNEEALLVEPRLRHNGGKLITALLASSVRSPRGEKLPPAMVRRLTSADRNFLLLELRRLTFGDELEARYQCPRCRESTLVLEDLGALDVRTPEDGAQDEILVELEDGYRDPSGAVHRELVFGLATGEDEEAAGSGGRESNPSRQRDALLARSLRRVGDLEPHRVDALGARILADLSMPDRLLIQQALDAATPGPDLMRTIVCAHCREEFRAPLDMTRFFPLA
jgi:hypothetical protein